MPGSMAERRFIQFQSLLPVLPRLFFFHVHLHLPFLFMLAALHFDKGLTDGKGRRGRENRHHPLFWGRAPEGGVMRPRLPRKPIKAL